MSVARFKRGLVIGKFCPLHLGHVLLVDHALAACEQLLIVSYTVPEFEGCEPLMRERWLHTQWPGARVMVFDQAILDSRCARMGIATRAVPHNDDHADAHRAFVAWICATVLDCTVDAVFTSEDYGDGFAAALSVYFGHPVQHVCVDKSRATVPVSGTAVRADVHRFRGLMPAHVVASFVGRVAILGGESSGKTVLAQALAERLGTCWVPEYGRTLWVEKGGKLVFEDMLAIAQGQVEHEAALSQCAHRWLICDSTPLTSLFYSINNFGRADAELAALAERQYDHVFVCAPDFPFVQDGTRRDEAFRARQHAWYYAWLRERDVRFAILAGAVDNRIGLAMTMLSAQRVAR